MATAALEAECSPDLVVSSKCGIFNDQAHDALALTVSDGGITPDATEEVRRFTQS